jgi:hypothetical protein
MGVSTVTVYNKRTEQMVFLYHTGKPKYFLLTGGSGLPSADFKFPLRAGRQEAGMVVNNPDNII